jgi:hypothetical protein
MASSLISRSWRRMKISEHLRCYQGSRLVATSFDEIVACSRLTTTTSRQFSWIAKDAGEGSLFRV